MIIRVAGILTDTDKLHESLYCGNTIDGITANGRTNARTDGWMDGWMDRGTANGMNKYIFAGVPIKLINSYNYLPSYGHPD